MTKIFELLSVATLASAATLSISAAVISIPNASFEGPATEFADPRVDQWQEIPEPEWFPQSAESWDQLTGVFLNTTNGRPDHIDNIDGSQALFLTAVPGVGIFQDYNSFDWANTNSPHAFDATFEAGKSYQFTAGLIGGGGNMIEGASLLLSLYYHDASNNVVTIGSSNVVFTRSVFTNTTHFIDQRVRIPTVRATDAWAGQKIGVMIMSSIVDTNFAGGYWDIDNARLESFVDEIAVPNASFEGPATVFADPRVDSWQEIPRPEWFPQSAESWDQLTGVFLNTTNGRPDHIDNIDGSQALFLTAVPGVGIFQDYNSFDWANTNATHAFDAAYEPGNSYELAVGVLAGGGNMIEGASLLLSLYYHDASNNVVTVGASNVVFSRAVFTNTTHFIDQHVPVPAVRPGDAWAGKNIGIMIMSSIADTNLVGGYWDLDNVRLRVTPNAAVTLTVARSGLDGSNIEIAWPSQVGYDYQLRTSENLTAWTNLGAPVAGTGGVLSQLAPQTGARGFFDVVATPRP